MAVINTTDTITLSSEGTTPTFSNIEGHTFDMNKPVFPYLYTVIAFELAVYLFETYLNWRQYKKYCEKEMPKEITTIVTNE